MIKVLIVDDNHDFRRALVFHLKAQDVSCEIQEAFSGEMAIAIAMHQKPDVVLMDIRLPGVDGFESAKKIKEAVPNCEIIALTMFETEEGQRNFSQAGISVFMGKADAYEKLMPAIQKCLQGVS